MEAADGVLIDLALGGLDEGPLQGEAERVAADVPCQL